jgi:hypothetical protein
MIQSLQKIKKLIKVNFNKNDIKFLKKCDVLFFCHDNDRGLSIDGQAFSPLLDSVFIEMSNKGFSCQSISLPWSTMSSNQIHVNSLNLNNKYLLFGVLNKVRSLFGVAKKNFYLELLEKTKPVAVIGIGLPQKLCLACKELKIIDVELLHGIGYTFLPWGWQNLNASRLPSLVLALDKISAQTFNQLNEKGVDVISIPHPFLKMYHDNKFSNIKNWIYSIDKSYKKHILVTLQWGYAGENEDFRGIVENGIFYQEIEGLIKKRSDFFWHFRLHPAQIRGSQSDNAMAFILKLSKTNSNICWDSTSKVPLVSVASVCDAHLTLSSMSCYEVASLGIPSMILCPRIREAGKYSDYYNDLVAEGYAIKANFDVNFIEQWIDSIIKMARRPLIDDSIESWEDFIVKLKKLTKL